MLEALEAGSAYAPLSLSAGPSGDEDDLDPMETIGRARRGVRRAPRTATSLEPALAALPEREREILRMRFEEGLTQTQIAERIGISQMHVSRLIRRSLERMREPAHASAPWRLRRATHGLRRARSRGREHDRGDTSQALEHPQRPLGSDDPADAGRPAEIAARSPLPALLAAASQRPAGARRARLHRRCSSWPRSSRR